ncbi:MAG: histidine kinase dimerization/phospho-acceptor domain-containing protein [Candidatus Polarisedimenticolia bacterium]
MTARMVLLVGDEPSPRALLAPVFDLTVVTGAREALRALEHQPPPAALVMVDPLPDGTALDLMAAARRLHPCLATLVIARNPDPGAAIAVMKAGCDDYLGLNDPALARLPWIVSRVARDRLSGPALGLMHSISHDMRTPLSGLTALIQMLTGGSDGPLTAAQHDRLHKIRKAADRLTAIAGQLADLTLIHDGRMTLSPSRVDLAEAAARVVGDAAQLARDHAVELRMAFPPDLPPVHADGRRLSQALGLLLTGAVRHAAPGVLELSARMKGTAMELTLREVPRSVPVEALDGSIDADARLEAGLGISVARGLVDLHGGRLKLGAEAGEGRLAVLELPCDGGPRSSRTDTPRPRRARP